MGAKKLRNPMKYSIKAIDDRYSGIWDLFIGFRFNNDLRAEFDECFHIVSRYSIEIHIYLRIMLFILRGTEEYGCKIQTSLYKIGS